MYIQPQLKTNLLSGFTIHFSNQPAKHDIHIWEDYNPYSVRS